VEPIGYAVLFDVAQDAGSGTIAYWIAPPAQGEGYMTEAATLLLEYAFGQRRLNRIEARALADNEASRGLLRGLGFVEEGVEREAKFVAGEHRDEVRYAVLSGEWR
jgi:ribosomal-protein-alanine N-acetyltransferase